MCVIQSKVVFLDTRGSILKSSFWHETLSHYLEFNSTDLFLFDVTNTSVEKKVTEPLIHLSKPVEKGDLNYHQGLVSSGFYSG